MPLNASRVDVRVNFIEYWEIGPDQVQHFSWVTDLRVSTRNVYKLMRGGRARWKIENETFNTLKNQGYNFEHNYGHGEQHLSVVFAMLMMLAFLVDQSSSCAVPYSEPSGRNWAASGCCGAHAGVCFMIMPWSRCGNCSKTLFYGLKKLQPLLAVDSS